MSASVLGNGRTLSNKVLQEGLMQVYAIDEAPQVHIHLLTDDDEYEDTGEGAYEMCCHGCGTSVFVRYADFSPDTDGKIRDQFFAEHANCPDHGYEAWCPDIRTRFFTVDSRQGARRNVRPRRNKGSHCTTE